MTKARVITIKDNERSRQTARRTITTGAKVGVEVLNWKATTPADDPEQIAEDKGIPLDGFREVYSRFDRCLSAFLSHHSLWEHCVEINEDILILEHDAVFVAPPPVISYHYGIVNLGKPSYGKHVQAPTLGLGKLVSKQYLPGAHAYLIEPSAAQMLIDTAKIEAGPTDVWINNARFNFIQEYYPWPVEVKDNFSTIQVERGCTAKHSWNGGLGYDII